MIRIEVTSDRGEGATTVCMALVKLLRRFGQSAEYRGFRGHQSDPVENLPQGKARLHADYPEVCVPVRALENTPNRAHYQVVSGDRHDDGKPYEAATGK